MVACGHQALVTHQQLMLKVIQLVVVEEPPPLAARLVIGGRGQLPVSYTHLTVLSACDGEEAIQVAREHDGPIHLLLTDVVMPRLEGGELAAELQRKRPGLATLFISGYTDQRLMTRLPDNPRPMVLQKPIKLRDLLNTIGEVMHPVN